MRPVFRGRVGTSPWPGIGLCTGTHGETAAVRSNTGRGCCVTACLPTERNTPTSSTSFSSFLFLLPVCSTIPQGVGSGATLQKLCSHCPQFPASTAPPPACLQPLQGLASVIFPERKPSPDTPPPVRGCQPHTSPRSRWSAPFLSILPVHSKVHSHPVPATPRHSMCLYHCMCSCSWGQARKCPALSLCHLPA